MKKLMLMLALFAFIGANTVSKAANISSAAKVECEKCGKDGKCTKECKEGKKSGCCKKDAKACSSKGTEGTASAEGEAPKSCGMKKSCCKSKAKAEASATPVENTPAEK